MSEIGKELVKAMGELVEDLKKKSLRKYRVTKLVRLEDGTIKKIVREKA